MVGSDVAKIADEVNKHTHTKSCRKYDSQCRFQFQRYPSMKTVIAVPLVGKSASERKCLLKEQREILRKVGKILDDEDAVREIIESIGHSIEES